VTTTVISVLIADDHMVVRRGLRAVFEAEPGVSVVGEAANGVEVIEAVQRLQPDVVVLDLMMPGMSGLDVLKALTADSRSTRVVVLSMHASEAYVIEALRHGALGYVVKDAPASELLQAVHHAAAGRQFLGSPFSPSLLEAYTQRVRAASQDPYETLTARERQVLHLAAEGHTNQEIGKRLSISRRTAETHRANLMRKLGLKGQPELIRFALRRGILTL
jgi:DNA-binding NarL/FixJ family response regulator